MNKINIKIVYNNNNNNNNNNNTNTNNNNNKICSTTELKQQKRKF